MSKRTASFIASGSIIACLAFSFIPGCASAPRFSSTPSSFRDGWLEKTYNFGAPALHDAALQSLKQLHLVVLEDKKEGSSFLISSKFGDGTPAEIKVAPITENSSMISIHVGASGNENRSRAILYSIESNLGK
jgi:hypothetical protein